MSDEFDDLEDEFEATMLVVEERADGELEIDDPSGKLSENDRIAMLLRALILELGPDIVAVLESLQAEDDEDA